MKLDLEATADELDKLFTFLEESMHSLVLDQLQADVAQLKTDVSALQAGAATDEQAIAALDTRVTALEAQLPPAGLSDKVQAISDVLQMTE